MSPTVSLGTSSAPTVDAPRYSHSEYRHKRATLYYIVLYVRHLLVWPARISYYGNENVYIEKDINESILYELDKYMVGPL